MIIGIPSPVIGYEGWSASWAWGLPIVVLNVIIHVLGLSRVRAYVLRASNRSFTRRYPATGFAIVVGIATLPATCLHAVETGVWAFAFRALNAVPDARTAMLYSLNAVTSYGHVSIELAYHWQLMGALEALNGWLLFGLTTAFLFATMEKMWSLDQTFNTAPPVEAAKKAAVGK